MGTLTRRASIGVTVLVAMAAVAWALVWRSGSVFGQEGECELVPAFAVANTLHYVSPESIVWVDVRSGQEFRSRTLFSGWNLFSLS